MTDLERPHRRRPRHEGPAELATVDDPRYPVPDPGDAGAPAPADRRRRGGRRPGHPPGGDVVRPRPDPGAIGSSSSTSRCPRTAYIDFGPLHANAAEPLLRPDPRPGAAAHRHRRRPVGPAADGRPARWSTTGTARPPSDEDARVDRRASWTRASTSPSSPAARCIGRSLLGALGLVALPVSSLLADLGPWPTKKCVAETIETTIWDEGIRLVNDVTYEPIKAERDRDRPAGQRPAGEPAGATTAPSSRSRRPRPRSSSSGWTRTRSRSPTRARTGTSAASSATPRSAPTSAARSACGSSRPTTCSAPATSRPSTWVTPAWWSSDPAARSLPQLPITIDAEGYLVARSGFTVPTGPSYFERDSRNDFKEGDN